MWTQLAGQLLVSGYSSARHMLAKTLDVDGWLNRGVVSNGGAASQAPASAPTGTDAPQRFQAVMVKEQSNTHL